MWTKEDLQRLVQRQIGDYRLIIVSNRQPYIHNLVDGEPGMLYLQADSPPPWIP